MKTSRNGYPGTCLEASEARCDCQKISIGRAPKRHDGLVQHYLRTSRSCSKCVVIRELSDGVGPYYPNSLVSVGEYITGEVIAIHCEDYESIDPKQSGKHSRQSWRLVGAHLFGVVTRGAYIPDSPELENNIKRSGYLLAAVLSKTPSEEYRKLMKQAGLKEDDLL